MHLVSKIMTKPAWSPRVHARLKGPHNKLSGSKKVSFTWEEETDHRAYSGHTGQSSVLSTGSGQGTVSQWSMFNSSPLQGVMPQLIPDRFIYNVTLPHSCFYLKWK